MQVQSLIQIIRALNEAGVQYLIVGGVAVNAHGFERYTKDVDLVIGLDPHNITQGLHALESIDYHMSIPVSPEDFASEENREMWKTEKNMIVLKLWSDQHQRTPIDVFIYEPFNFQAEYAKRKIEKIEGFEAPIVSLESLFKMKRDANRNQDLIDIENLQRIQELRKEI